MDDLEQRVAFITACRLRTNLEKARAIIPIVMEEAAKVAQDADCSLDSNDHIAAAIRALGQPK